MYKYSEALKWGDEGWGGGGDFYKHIKEAALVIMAPQGNLLDMPVAVEDIILHLWTNPSCWQICQNIVGGLLYRPKPPQNEPDRSSDPIC